MQKGLILIGAHDFAAEEINRVPRCIPFDYMAIGMDSVEKYAGRLSFFATYHPEDIKEAFARRRNMNGNTDFKVVGHKRYEGVDITIPFEEPSGSSALLGAMAGLRLLYKKIILCGCPLTGKNPKGVEYDQFQRGWKAKETIVKDTVRSMGGWTADYLGKPTKGWLLSD